jgi:hypothetical protein
MSSLAPTSNESNREILEEESASWFDPNRPANPGAAAGAVAGAAAAAAIWVATGGAPLHVPPGPAVSRRLAVVVVAATGSAIEGGGVAGRRAIRSRTSVAHPSWRFLRRLLQKRLSPRMQGPAELHDKRVAALGAAVAGIPRR